MSPLPSNWYFGSLARPDSVRNPFGGFDLGDVQSMLRPNDSMTNPPSASAPSAGVSGSVPGQPPTPSPTGGMDALRVPFDQTGATEGTESSSNANVTGFNGPLAMAGLNALGVVPGVPGVGALFSSLGPLASIFGGTAGRIGMNAGANALPSNMTTNGPMMAESGTAIPSGSPVTYSGNFFGLPTGSLMAQVPGPRATSDPANIVSQDLSVQVPSVSPNPTGSTAPGIWGGARPQVDQPDAGKGPDPSVGGVNGGGTGIGAPGSGVPGGAAAAPSGDVGDAGPAGTGGGGAGSGVGTGTAGGAGGDAGGAGGAYKKGGRVRGHRPDPRMLAAKLRQGAKVDVGDPRATTDNVKRVDLQTGEEVMNRPAARAHAAQLEAWNRIGRRAMGQGGMAVGAPRDQRR
jgi:hypothetical protein